MAGAPPIMDGLVVDNPTEFTVDVNWKKVDGAKSYKLYRRKIPEEWDDSNFVEISDPKQTKLTLDDLEPTSTYQFRIAAVTSQGEGEKSELVTIDTAVGNCGPSKKKCIIQ